MTKCGVRMLRAAISSGVRLTETCCEQPTKRFDKAFWLSIWVRRTALATCLAASVAGTGSAGTITLNFDAVPLGPSVEVDATSYLSSFGVTLSAVTPGASVLIIGQGSPGLPIATSAPNYFNEFNGNSPETMTLNFSSALSGISFYRTGMTYDSKPQWTAEALNAQGVVVATVGEPLTATGAAIGPQLFTLAGANITALRINSNNGAFTNLSGVPIDDLTLTTQASVTTPEPKTSILLISGLVGLVSVYHRAKRSEVLGGQS